MRITIPSKLKTLSHLLQLLIRPYHFGFIRGHWYLTTSQIDELSSIVVRQNPENRLVENYERSFSKLIGNGFGKSYAAGRMGFYALMKILKIGPGDEVILLAFTCSVMANAVWRVGATPIYADIDPETFGSSAPAIEQKISSRTKLIVVQHSFGIPCKIDEIVNLGQRHGIFVLEDCAITVDSLYKGISVGNWGDAAIFSTDHSKPLNTLIGGFLYTRHLNLFNKIKTFSKDLPHLEFGQQKRLFKQILIEKKYCLPRKYPRMRIGQHAKSGHIRQYPADFEYIDSISL